MLAELEVNMAKRQYDLTDEEKFSFPLGGNMSIDTDQENSEDFFELWKDAPSRKGGTLCENVNLLGVKETTDDLKGNASYGFKISATEVNLAKVVSVKGMYDASRGSFKENAYFPHYKEKCCNVAQEYYSGFRDQGVTDPEKGLAYHYAIDNFSDNTYEQLFIGYDMSNTNNHPYKAENPYGTNGLSQDVFQGSFDSTIFHNTYIKRIETLKTKVNFPNLQKAYFKKMELHNQHSDLIKVEKTKITFYVNQCPNNGKHQLNLYTCRSCVKEQEAGAYNITEDVGPAYDRGGFGTADFNYNTDYGNPDYANPCYNENLTGDPGWGRQGCQDCHDELLEYFNYSNGDGVATNLITRD